MNRLAWPLAALTGVVGFLLALVVIRTGPATSGIVVRATTPGSPALVVQAAPAQLGNDSEPAPALDFAPVAARLNAAVVNVDAASRGDASARAPQWRRDMPDDPAAPREGTGSGFIIDPAGYILTNFHVVDGADRVTVTLTDGRAFRADVAGIDPALDVALLKIASADPLPVAVLGNSSSLKVGQWVCAIGNPLGYVHSVTVGVVSFMGRKLFDQTLDAYIQTDAAISLGNSGGPLIDAGGHVVGITTAISSQAANIGFAIPIGQVLAVLPQLRERGRVSRGYVGVSVTRITPALQRALGLQSDHGALVQDVTPDSAAERAGLRPYDVVTTADAAEIRTDDDFIRHITARAPGTVSSLQLLRGDAVATVSVKLSDRPVPPAAMGRFRKTGVQQAAGHEQGPLGFLVRDLDPASALRKALPDVIQGVLVADVDAAGPGRLAHLRPGQLVLEINRRPTATAQAFQAALASLAPSAAVALLIYDPITEQRLLVTISPDRYE